MASGQGFTTILNFADASTATIVYTARGASGLSKEYIEAHSNDRSGVLDDFKSLVLVDGRKSVRRSERKQNKGHITQIIHMREVLAGRAMPCDLDPLDSMRTTLSALTAASVHSDLAGD